MMTSLKLILNKFKCMLFNFKTRHRLNLHSSFKYYSDSTYFHAMAPIFLESLQKNWANQKRTGLNVRAL